MVQRVARDTRQVQCEGLQFLSNQLLGFSNPVLHHALREIGIGDLEG